jgi:hypothetical protein
MDAAALLLTVSPPLVMLANEPFAALNASPDMPPVFVILIQ